MNQPDGKWKRFLKGASVGALAGFAIGLLNAPQSGDETRAELRARGEEAVSRTEGSIEDIKARTRAIAVKLTSGLADIRDQAAATLASVRTAATSEKSKE